MQQFAYLMIDGERIDVLCRPSTRVGRRIKLASSKQENAIYLQEESEYLSEFRPDKLADLKAGKVVSV